MSSIAKLYNYTKKIYYNCSVQWKEPITSTFGNNLTMYAPNLPSCGILLTFMMNVLENFIPSTKDNVFWQRIIETFKWAYGRRTELGDNPSPELGTFNYFNSIDSINSNNL